MTTVARLGRVLVVVIALVGVVDPVWTVAREARPVVALSVTAGASQEDVAAVARALDAAAVVTRDWRPDTAATVIVGQGVPDVAPAGKVIAVTSAPQDRPMIQTIAAPARVPLDGAAHVDVTLAVPSEITGDVRVRLLVDGTPQDTSALRHLGASELRHPGTSAPRHLGTSALRLTAVPSRPGLARVRVEASIGDGPVSVADTVMEVVDTRWRVLVFDGRPTWASTFVRRALEDDPRFDVVARTTTSRGASAQSGTAPVRLSDPGVLSRVSLVVVGAPDALTSADVDALDRYMRDQQGAVVLLPEREDDAALARLTGVSAWREERQPDLVITNGVAGGALRASEFVWPLSWPRLAEPVAECQEARDCAVWRLARGGGQVIVSSAADAWRLRTADESAYERFWRHVAATAAEATPPAVSLSMVSPVVAPGGVARATLTRLLTSGGAAPPVGEWQDTQGERGAITWWPRSSSVSEAEFRVPATPGRYRLVSTVGDDTARAEFLVVEPGDWTPAVPDQSIEREALVAAHTGAIVAPSDMGTLPDVVRRVAGGRSEEVPVAPMRSPWWLLPCIALLSFEWWTRRRHGAR
jgi:hypothetical protein